MSRTFELLAGTVELRPYVFVFFAFYLVLAITHIGVVRTALFTLVAYLVAFVCEWSSAVARTGFPFGLYYYIDSTSHQELWIAGVPFMDSLSFTFLSYVSWEMAALCLGRGQLNRDKPGVIADVANRRSWRVTLFAAFLMMCLDIVIDPVALLGERWFLGKIYLYPDGGSYFGVTLANFAGWFFVCLAILRIFIFLERRLFDAAPTRVPGIYSYPLKWIGPIGLYFGVLGFNLFMTFRIGETRLGTVSSLWIIGLALLTAYYLSRRFFGGDRQPAN